MKCPHILVDPSRKICRQMLNQGLDGELDDFDVTHYCECNPNYCFFFRSCNNRTQVTERLKENGPVDPVVPMASIILSEPTQPDESSSKQSDKLLKLKRLLHRIV